DIYIPSKNIAIEYNGMYWHSSHAPNTKYTRYTHYKKWKQCADNGIQLITIWEDDWKNKKTLIQNMLKHKIGVNTQHKIAARKTYIDVIPKNEAQELYENHHIQGHKNGYHIGLKTVDTHQLVAVSTWIRMPSTEEVRLERFATNTIIQGGFSKLLKYAIQLFTEEGFKNIVTFADHEVSNGKLYQNTGFIIDKEIRPDYKYIFKEQRNHKFGFRKKRFKNDPELLYNKNLTEKELAKLNNLAIVWDCGKTRYTYQLDNT